MIACPSTIIQKMNAEQTSKNLNHSAKTECLASRFFTVLPTAEPSWTHYSDIECGLSLLFPYMPHGEAAVLI